MKLGIRRDELGELLGSEQLAREMIADGWLTPILEEHKLTLFALADVAKAFARLTHGQRPAKLHSRVRKNLKAHAE